MLFQVVPWSVEYSHVPPEFEFCVIAMPVRLDVVFWTLLLVKIAAINSPAGFVVFSATGARVPAPTPATSMVTVWVAAPALFATFTVKGSVAV